MLALSSHLVLIADRFRPQAFYYGYPAGQSSDNSRQCHHHWIPRQRSENLERGCIRLKRFLHREGIGTSQHNKGHVFNVVPESSGESDSSRADWPPRVCDLPGCS